MAEFFTVVLALSFGSFANVFRIRYPQGRSLWRPPSHCPRCRKRLRWWHNLPLAGWLMLRGRCAFCRAPVSAKYPAMEAAFGLAAWIFVHRFGVTPESGFYLAFALSLILVAWVDWETQYIFDVVSLPLLGLGLAASFCWPGRYGAWWASALGAAGMAGLMLGLAWLGRAFYRREALGLGDVKLMAAAGAWLGWQEAWKALILGVLAGLPLMLLHQRLNKRSWREPAPFGPGLCAGCAVALWNFLSQGDLDPWMQNLGLDLLSFRAWRPFA